MNPILNALNARNTQNSLSGIRQMYQAYKNAGNPQAFLQSILSSNPAYSNLIQGGNLKDKFYSLCSQRGINPDDILNQLR